MEQPFCVRTVVRAHMGIRQLYTVNLKTFDKPLAWVSLKEKGGSSEVALRVFGVSQLWYQWTEWYTNIVQCFTNGTIGNTICTNGNANGTIGSPNGTIGTNGKPMVPLVKLPMVPLGEFRTEPLCVKS